MLIFTTIIIIIITTMTYIIPATQLSSSYPEEYIRLDKLLPSACTV